LSRQRQDSLEHGDADRQIAVEIKEGGKQIGWLYGNEFSNGEPCRRLDAIKADWYAI
jgi:hypothetical protein